MIREVLSIITAAVVIVIYTITFIHAIGNSPPTGTIISTISTSVPVSTTTTLPSATTTSQDTPTSSLSSPLPTGTLAIDPPLPSPLPSLPDEPIFPNLPPITLPDVTIPTLPLP